LLIVIIVVVVVAFIPTMSSSSSSTSTAVKIDTEHQLAPLKPTPETLEKLLNVIEQEIVPLTQKGVLNGNKVFGAAILNENLTPTLCQTNSELKSPLFHGEVHCIYEWSQQTEPGERGTQARQSVFLSTHEPCCMCISSIVWSGFQQCYYLFPYELTMMQGIPHDINIMHELWGVSSYRKQNKFISTGCLMTLVEELPESEPRKKALQAQIQRLVQVYDEMSKTYHTEKANNQDNSLAFG
jgi:tRNA(Arg) A34 adenosine deaminase TadA